jgi:hypothetical protein
MLGSPCSPCCNICGIDWTYASVVEIELEGTDYYSTWHGRSLAAEEPAGVGARDYYFSFGFKGSAYNGTFQLSRTFISNSLQFQRYSQWEYLMPGVQQFCQSGSLRPPGLHAFLWFPPNSYLGGTILLPNTEIFHLWPSGSSMSYVSVGSQSFTALDDMECQYPASRRAYSFATGLPSHVVDCTRPVEKVSSGWVARESDIVTVPSSPHMLIRFGALVDSPAQFNWIAVGGGTLGRDRFDWYGGLETVRQQVNPPPYINVEKISSTRAADPDKLPSYGYAFPLSELVKLKSVRVIV